MNKIAITGISGYVAQALLPYLEQDERVEQIIGIDRRPIDSARLGGKLIFYRLDMQDPAIDQALEGVDTLVHMAFVLMRRPGEDENAIDAINVGGAENVCRAAVRQRVRKLIFTSSVVAYGLYADNPIPLSEESMLRPNPGLYYSRAKAVVERFLETLAIENPASIVTRLRPCTVVGPHARPELMASLVARPAIAVRGFDPPVQLLHEDDLARALYRVVERDAPGAYNVTSDDALTLRQIARSQDAPIIALPYPIVRGLMALMWRAGRSAFAPQWADLSRYSLVASNDKLKTLGWTPRYSTAQALASVLNGRER